MKQPPITIPDTVDVPQADVHTAPNGVRIYAVECHDFDVVRLTFVFHAGTATQRHPFTASAAANMLAEGTERYTSQQIAERLDYHGSFFDINIDRDCTYVTFCALSKFFPQTAEVIEEVILRPAFPEHETAVYRDKRRQQLAIERRKTETVARENFARAMFGPAHPYGITSDEAEYAGLTRERIDRHYRRTYTAENCIVVCSGRLDGGVLDRITGIAGRLPRGERTRIEFPPVETLHDLRIPHAGAVQSSIRIGRLLFPRTHPDFVPMQVLSTVLGGYFGSRLMQNLRERNGYTYGVYAAMVNFQHAGYLAIATQVGRDVTDDALAQIAREIERLRSQPVEPQELRLVQNIMAGEMMRILDGPFGIADVTTENILCGFDNSQIQRNLQRIRATTPEELLDLARRYLAPEEMVTVVAGAADE